MKKIKVISVLLATIIAISTVVPLFASAATEGWVKTDNNWYYYENNAPKTGWLKDGNDWYYLNSSGKMVTGWLTENGVKYYLSSSGAMVTGWQQIQKNWYYFEISGAMKANSWLKDGNSWYWLKSDGRMASNETLTINGTKYTFRSNGVWEDPNAGGNENNPNSVPNGYFIVAFNDGRQVKNYFGKKYPRRHGSEDEWRYAGPPIPPNYTNEKQYNYLTDKEIPGNWGSALNIYLHFGSKLDPHLIEIVYE